MAAGLAPAPARGPQPNTREREPDFRRGSGDAAAQLAGRSLSAPSSNSAPGATSSVRVTTPPSTSHRVTVPVRAPRRPRTRYTTWNTAVSPPPAGPAHVPRPGTSTEHRTPSRTRALPGRRIHRPLGSGKTKVSGRGVGSSGETVDIGDP